MLMSKEELENLVQYLESRKRLYEQQLAVSVMDEAGFRMVLTKDELEELRNVFLKLVSIVNHNIQFFENELARNNTT